MNRLLKISFDLAISSIVPVLSWFILSIILDKNYVESFKEKFKNFNGQVE